VFFSRKIFYFGNFSAFSYSFAILLLHSFKFSFLFFYCMFDILFFLGLFLFGLFLGSFANVVLFRLHNEQSGIMNGRSECQKCHHPLGFWDLIPVFSWLFLGGKCRYCHAPLSWQYPLVEIFLGVLWVALFWCNGIGFENFFLTGEMLIEGIFWLFFAFFFCILFVADLRWMEVFRYISLPMIALLLGAIFVLEKIDIVDALIGVAIPTVFFGIQIVLSRYVFTSRGDWIGEGDIDIGIMMGLLLGWKLILVALFLAYISGAIVGLFIMRIKGRGAQVPFGPFLLFSLLLTFFWGNAILNWYLGILGV
jgi:prepilin signal peptidase PulO-like enzyme (type II secretory pathway)